MIVRELRDAIGEIQGICEAAGATKAAADLEELAQLFEGHDDQPVEQFLEYLRAIYTIEHLDRDKNSPADREVVDSYVGRLKEVAGDERAFERVMQTMRRDPLVGKAEANAIQHSYISGRETWPTKQAAFKAIEKWFTGSRFQRDVMEDIKKVTPW